MSYKGSAFYKRQKGRLIIAIVAVVLLLLIACAAYFFTECLVFTSDGYKIILPWKDYSVQPDTEPDDGAPPVIDIPEKETPDPSDTDTDPSPDTPDEPDGDESTGTDTNAGTSLPDVNHPIAPDTEN